MEAVRPPLPTRNPCGWCGERQRWPDLCPGDPPDEFCLEELRFRHGVGDHRRCLPADCTETVLLQEVAARGLHEAAASGKPYVVVNTMTDPWECRSFDRLQQAKPYRSRLGKAAGYQYSIEFKTKVFVVTADGQVI